MLKIFKNQILIKRGNSESSNLFLIHAGNGEIQNYIYFSSLLPSSITCWGIRANRFDNLYPSNETLKEVACRYISIIRSIQSQGPYNIFGWCFGGLRAYEIASQLEEAGDKVRFLGLVNAHVPFSTEQERKELVTKYSLLDYNSINQSYFTYESEKRLIMKWLSESELEWNVEYNSKEVWGHFAEFFKNHKNIDIILKVIKKDLPEDRKAAIPFIENITLYKLIYYLAVMRSDANSQAYYSLKRKISADTYFFNALESPVLNRLEWNQYTQNPLHFADIEGTHFSIFNSGIAENFAELFKQFYINKGG